MAANFNRFCVHATVENCFRLYFMIGEAENLIVFRFKNFTFKEYKKFLAIEFCTKIKNSWLHIRHLRPTDMTILPSIVRQKQNSRIRNREEQIKSFTGKRLKNA